MSSPESKEPLPEKPLPPQPGFAAPPPMQPGPGGVMHAPPPQSGMSVFAIVAIVFGVLLVVGVVIIGILAALLLPAIQHARGKAMEMQTRNQVKQIGIAVNSHEAMYGEFPAASIREAKTDKPLLSWRVEMLRFMDEEYLYQEFHRDEPWNSPHNLQLIERMPEVYKSLRFEDPPGHTRMLAVVGDRTILTDQRPVDISDVRDGLSNTVLFVQADRAVPWTKPEDIAFDALPTGLSGGPDGEIICGFGDGSVRSYEAETVRRYADLLFDRADGKPLPPELD